MSGLLFVWAFVVGRARCHDRIMHDLDTTPPFASLVRETTVIADVARYALRGRRVARVYEGRGRPVMVIPGFLATDGFTIPLRRALASAGYRSFGWGLGRNTGVAADIFERLDRQLDVMLRDTDDPVALVGWSLGGLIAREYAKHAPGRVERVITLGSPFSGDIRANHAWRLYERVNGHPVDRLPIPVTLAVKPPVPTTALWSRADGIVAPGSSRGQAGEADRMVELSCTHMGFVVAEEALAAVLQALRG